MKKEVEMNDQKKYDANFTAGGILFNEFKSLESIITSPEFDELVENEKEENKVIGISTNSARKRIISEIKRRYNCVPKEFWIHFYNWNEQEQKLALFYVCLKTYPLILDLHFEVALKKFKTGSSLDAYDIQMRMDEIASFDEDVARWSPTTTKKINVQYRKALKDAGLYNVKALHKTEKASSMFWDYFLNHNESWFLEACFKNNN